jgi:hypothetical protein
MSVKESDDQHPLPLDEVDEAIGSDQEFSEAR